MSKGIDERNRRGRSLRPRRVAVEPIEYEESSGSRFSLLASTGFLGLAGLVMTLSPRPAGMPLAESLMTRLFGVFFALIGVTGFWGLVRRWPSTRVALRLDSEGVHARNLQSVYDFDLSWSEIVGVRVQRHDGKRFVVLDVSDLWKGFHAQRESVAGKRGKLLGAVGSPFAFPAGLFRPGADALRDEIDRRLVAAKG